MNLFLFLSFQLLPLSMGNKYPSISKIGQGQHSPALALESYISAYSKCGFQIPHPRYYQSVNFQLTSSCESEDIPIFVFLRMLLSITL